MYFKRLVFALEQQSLGGGVIEEECLSPVRKEKEQQDDQALEGRRR
jgi:hypothetical protein